MEWGGSSADEKHTGGEVEEKEKERRQGRKDRCV